MAKINKEINLQFTAEGLDAIGEQIKKVIPSLPQKKNGKQPGIDLLNRQQALLAQYNKAGGKLDPIATEGFLKEYLSLLNALDSLKTKLVSNLTPKLQEQRKVLKDNLTIAEDILSKQKKAIAESKEDVSRDASGKLIMDKDFTRKQMSTISTEGLTSVTGQSIKNFETIVANREKAIDAINALNQKEAIAEQQRAAANVTTEEEIKLEEIWLKQKADEEKIQTNLNSLKQSGNINYQDAIKDSEGKTLEELLQIKKNVEENSEMSDSSNTWSANSQYLNALNYAIELKKVQEDNLRIEQQLSTIRDARNQAQSELIGLTQEEVDKRDKLLEKIKSYDSVIQEMEKRASAQIKTTEGMEKDIPGLEGNVAVAKKAVMDFDDKNLKSGNEEIQKLIQSVTDLVNILKGEYEQVLEDNNKGLNQNQQAHERVRKAVEKNSGSVKIATKNIINYTLIFSTLKRLFRETIRTITELDKSLTDMAIVTEMNRKQAWELIPTLQDLAKETGMTTTEIAALTTEYLKQGKTLKDALILTEVAAKSAKIAGISATESVKYLTAAINGFSLSAEDATAVADKFAAVAAASATDYEQLAVGMSKFASQANLAGISMDFAMGMLAKGVETTQEAPESIGTALKTVLARMRELTDYGKTLEDGMNVNRVETALEQIGVSLRGANGEFRSMEQVLNEVGMAWETLNTNQQASVAVAMAGTRQQSRLIAILNDYDRTLELVNESQDSAGAMNAQHQEYMKGMAAALTKLQTAWQGLITTVTDSEVIIGIINTISFAIDMVSNALDAFGIAGKNAMIVILGIVATIQLHTMWTKLLAIAVGDSAKAQAASVAVDKIKLGLEWLKTKATIQNTAAVKAGNVVGALKAGLDQFKLLLLNKEIIAERRLYRIIAMEQYLNSKGIITNTLDIATKAGQIAITKLYIKTKMKENLVLIKNIALQALAYWWVALIIAGIALLVVGIIALVKHLNYINKSLADFKDEVNALNYELNQTNNSMQSLIDKYDELSSKKIKTDEDIAALKSLEDELKALNDGEYVVYNAFNEIDWDASIQKINEAIEKNQQSIIKNLAKIMDKAWLEFGKGRITKEQAMEETALTFITSYQYNTDTELTNEQKEGLSQYFANVYSQYAEELDGLNGDLQKLYAWAANQNVANVFETYLEKSKQWESNILDADNLYEQYQKYIEVRENLDPIADKELIDALDAEYKTLNYIRENFAASESILKSRTNILEALGFNAENYNDLSTAARIAGQDFDVLVEEAARLSNIYTQEGYSSAEAISLAWSGIASNIDNATFRAELFKLAMQDSTLNTAQTIDGLNNSIKNLAETQKKFLSGELSDEEFYNYVNEHPDLFANQEFVDAFKKGKDASIYLLGEVVKQEDIYRAQLIAVQAQLTLARENGDQGLIDSYQLEVNRLTLLLEYDGLYKGLTKKQIEYNNALNAYNNLVKIGLEDSEDGIEARQKMLDTMVIATAQTIAKNGEMINSLLDDYNTKLQEEAIKYNTNADDFKKGVIDLSEVFSVVNGTVIVSNWDLYNQLSENFDEYLDEYQTQLQEYLNSTVDAFNSWKKAWIDQQTDILDDNIDAYKKYFDDLDRLTQRETNEKDRNSIVAQLQRLQGATDEKSRKLAKDLKAELIEMDEEAAQQERDYNKEDLMNSLEMQKEALKDYWDSVATTIISAMETGGAQAALAYIAGVYGADSQQYKDAANFLGEGEYVPPTTVYNPYSSNTEEANAYRAGIYGTTYSGTSTQAFEEGASKRTELGTGNIVLQSKEVYDEMKRQAYNTLFNNIADSLAFDITPGITVTSSDKERIKELIPDPIGLMQNKTRPEQLLAFLEALGYPMDPSDTFIDNSFNALRSEAIRSIIPHHDSLFRSRRSLADESRASFGWTAYKTGGLVDYTGPALVHGTSTKPEAFLNADQTALFTDLRDMLSSVSFDGISSSPVVIENITIQTASLNNNQDFVKAGNSLAEAFSSAINRRGLNLNTKR